MGKYRNASTLEGLELILKIKTSGKIVPINRVPAIFARLASLNKTMVQTGITYKMNKNYYYLVENISEEAIDCYKSITTDLQSPNVVELRSFSYLLPDSNFTSIPNEFGISQLVISNYNNANSEAFQNNEAIFEPFSKDLYNGQNFNSFIDSYTSLTSFSNTPSVNQVKLYNVLFLAKSTITLGSGGSSSGGSSSSG
jgi:hypothetical protein